MKLAEHFFDFLDTTVNLNKTRIQTLQSKVDAIKNFISSSTEWEYAIISFTPQGSWAHGTIIKPVENKGFDADLILFLNPIPNFDAKDYINALTRTFRANGIYSDKTTSYSHCVTIEYAGDFRIDIAPCIIGRSSYLEKEVCNRTKNKFEPTEPEAYTDWIIQRDLWSGEHGLEKVTRLLKYLRDIKTTFTCPSILLTTLLANQIYYGDQNTKQFEDIPSSLQTVISRLDTWLQQNNTKPPILNPVMPREDFSALWDDVQYENFRKVIHRYRLWIDEAVAEPDYVESIKKWRRVFEDDFAKGEALDKAINTLKALAESVRLGFDFVDAVKEYGSQILERMPKSFPHMKIVPYTLESRQIGVKVKGFEKSTKEGNTIKEIVSGETIRPYSGIEFHAVQTTGLAFPKDYFIKWQVVNTDVAAANDNSLRGGFYGCDVHGKRWEATKYRGVHWVQAFVISTRTQKVVGSSERFFVVIE